MFTPSDHNGRWQGLCNKLFDTTKWLNKLFNVLIIQKLYQLLDK